MLFKLKVKPEGFSTPYRSSYEITEIQARVVGDGNDTIEGVGQLYFYFSYLNSEGNVCETSNVNIEEKILLPDGTEYELLSNLFSTDAVKRYTAMLIVASAYQYEALPFEEQVWTMPLL